MSRIGLQSIEVADGVTVDVSGQDVRVKGPKGELSWTLPPSVSASVKDGVVTVSRLAENKRARAMHGTARALIANMIVGVNTGYTKILRIEGVGYKADLVGRVLNLALGYSHNIAFPLPDGVEAVVEGAGTSVTLTGMDKQVVGAAAAQIRGYSPAEPYKGKGVRYSDENVRRKAGKTVA